MIARFFIFAVCAALLPSAAGAQDSSHWGVAASVNPTWKVPDRFKIFFDAETAADITSRDFSIGIARGRTLGGDWSVSYVRKNFKDGSYADATEQRCDEFVPGCFLQGSRRTLRGTTLSGILAVKYINFGTIRQRVQIGLNVGGGIGSLQGDLDVREYDVDVTCGNQGQCTGRQTETAFTADAKTELFALPTYPLGKVEAAVGVIVAPGLKVRVAGGLDFPGTSSFNLTGVYLIGAR